MYQGKHYQKNEHVEKRSRAKKPLAALVALVLIIGAVVGGTLAYLAARTDAIVNTFNPAKVDIMVEENFDGSTKKDVKIKNTGDTEVYIRATYVVTWKDAAGNVYPEQPQSGVDYNISLNLEQGWFYYNGYYYYTAPVAPLASTGVLIDLCTPVTGRAPEGYTLSVNVLASAIQSVPAEAVGEAWGVSIAPGSVTAYSAGN
ncbi:MAG: hypothetical protein DBY22_03035 [Clostridiales bacterium]|nr:MAG: hypothetical protein DBY22_03035 [Clostridiales bacterium]